MGGLVTRDEAVGLVQRIISGDYADDSEVYPWLNALSREFGCPVGYLSDLIFWPSGAAPTAAEVVDQASAYRPIEL